MSPLLPQDPRHRVILSNVGLLVLLAFMLVYVYWR